MNLIFKVVNTDGEFIQKREDIIANLVLVYINKKLNMNELAEFEYIFFK